VATIYITATEGGRFGPLDGPFTLHAEPENRSQPIADTLIIFARHVAGGMSFYNNKTGFADSSLFKSFAAECFAELESDEPESAAVLSNLTIDCRALPEALRDDKMWQLHRAILATLPGAAFLE
jgi:hypothetical protein